MHRFGSIEHKMRKLTLSSHGVHVEQWLECRPQNLNKDLGLNPAVASLLRIPFFLTNTAHRIPKLYRGLSLGPFKFEFNRA